MAILAAHVSWYERIFALPEFFKDPILLFGFQEIGIDQQLLQPSGPVPRRYGCPDLIALLRGEGHATVVALDQFDPRAQLRHDMNQPVPASEHERYGTLIDIGSLEHVFDTRQCLENCMRMLAPGGSYLLHTCVKGYFRHGLHTFHPDVLRDAFLLNGFTILLHAFSSWDGQALKDAGDAEDVLLWLVARKDQPLGRFECPQQGWQALYEDAQPSAPHALRLLKKWLYPFLPPILLGLYRRLRRRQKPALVAAGLRRR